MKSKLIGLALLCSSISYAQISEDFGFWAATGVEYKMNKKIRLLSEVQVRTEDNAMAMNQAFVEFGAKYRFNKKHSAALVYRPRMKYYYGNPDFQNRVHLDLNKKEKFGKINLSGRVRTQYLFRNDRNAFYQRYRLKGSYKLNKHSSVFAQAEAFVEMNNAGGPIWNKNRIGIGLNHEIGKKNELSLKYLRNSSMNVENPWADYIVSLSWKYSIK